MNIRNLSVIVSAITLLLLAAGVAGAIVEWSPAPQSAVVEVVSGGIMYQGRLTNPGGTPLNGTYQMRFRVHNAATGGSVVWIGGERNIPVENGFFNAKLSVDLSAFDGQALWLSITINGQTLSPRQEILPVPYALGLRPGADIVGDSIAQTDAVLAGYAPATGTALHADAAGGAGVSGKSAENYGVWGESTNSWGGYFVSDGGYGLVATTTGTDHWDHAGYFQAQAGYGLFAESAGNMAIRGHAGDITDNWQPVGAVGVVGIGQSRGVYGSAQSSYGIYGTSLDWYGIYGRTSRSDNNYGLYTPDNLYSSNIHTTGALMQVMQNSGTESLSPGDVAVLGGISHEATALDGPIVQVRKADEAGSAAVAGVVYSRFNIDAIDPELEFFDDSRQMQAEEMEVTPEGSAASGEYVLVVVQGVAQVKTNALDGEDIQPGDLLSTGSAPGSAVKAESVVADSATVAPGTVFGKALEAPSVEQEMIYVYVTLQ